MKFKTFFKTYQSEIIVWILLAKILLVGLTLADCLGALVVLLTMQAVKVLDYKYPKRPDLFHELSLVQEKLQKLITKNEELERDVSAMRIGFINKR